MKLQPGANLEGDGAALVADLPALGNAADQGLQVFGLEHHDSIIDVSDNLTGGELEYFGRIHGDDIGDVLSHNKGVIRRRRLR